eukprot:TRINITY_DN306257_c0_g1_i1.p1 TRINITY_DN306257_c0_g1~~TRINITY_DN306257_c0_g1_i1.p1  ORF type:complete len:243 (+),score=65.04 TRINITY_DN306257_c0_g1_i1:38-766(+)
MEYSKHMGQYLMQGYTMLADSCDKCKIVPLLGKNGESFCIKCLMESKENEKSVQEVKKASNTAPVQQNEPQKRKEEEEVDVPALLAEKMQSGWVLMNGMCSNCCSPVLRDLAGRIHCVKCKTQILPPSQNRQVSIPPPQIPQSQPSQSEVASTKVEDMDVVTETETSSVTQKNRSETIDALKAESLSILTEKLTELNGAMRQMHFENRTSVTCISEHVKAMKGIIEMIDHLEPEVSLMDEMC